MLDKISEEEDSLEESLVKEIDEERKKEDEIQKCNRLLGFDVNSGDDDSDQEEKTSDCGGTGTSKEESDIP